MQDTFIVEYKSLKLPQDSGIPMTVGGLVKYPPGKLTLTVPYLFVTFLPYRTLKPTTPAGPWGP